MDTPDLFPEIDWSFPASNRKTSIHQIHPYPAKFIPEIPRELIKLYGLPENTSVLDPFCGSGTTLVESQSAGFNSIGIDLNPIACLISRVKTSHIPAGLSQYSQEIVEKSRLCAQTESDASIPNVDHWFMEEVKVRLSQLSTLIRKDTSIYKDALSSALSSLIVRVSNQESDTRYAAIKKNITSTDVDELFIKSARRIEEQLCSERPTPPPRSQIIENDILKVSADDINEPIGLVITSPPYPNAYEYWLYHKYRMYWLGEDPKKVKESEIGARAHYFRKNPETIDDFQRKMTQVFSLLSQVCVDKAKVCFVIGRSKIRGKIYDNAELIIEAGKINGFKLIDVFDRSMKKDRKSFNLSHASIKSESIVIMEK